jgi:two-component system nitrogen regulation sensor histidine kinase NtrY
MNKGAFSLQGKFVFFSVALVLGAIFFTSLAFLYFPSRTALLISVVCLVPVTLLIAARISKPLLDLINALRDSTDSIKDQDYSVSIASKRRDELGDLVRRHNQIGALLREERYNINQRELLLDTVLQSAPVAMWLCDDRQRVVYSNLEARQLLADGGRIQGAQISSLIADLDEELAAAIVSEQEGLVSVDSAGEIQTWHLSCRFFSLNSRTHRLYLVRSMTREISRQEVNTWKRVIRVISHELNNSLAPISSLSHSGKITLGKLRDSHSRGALDEAAQQSDTLQHILITVGERARHLKEFIEGYAKFARLPSPRIQSFDLMELLQRMSEQQRFEVLAEQAQLEVRLDQAQFEQVLINLLKNARDASGADGHIAVRVEKRPMYLLVIVADDGPGMTDQVMQQALLPFYSTKQEGTGLGLPLCREIVEAHGGRLSIRNTAPVGLEVILRLPQGD